jgi:hypothetical protein
LIESGKAHPQGSDQYPITPDMLALKIAPVTFPLAIETRTTEMKQLRAVQQGRTWQAIKYGTQYAKKWVKQ